MSDKALRLAHERIEDLEALLRGRPLPIRDRNSPLRWILVVCFAAALGIFLPVHRTAVVVTTKWPPPIPPGSLGLADSAPPVFTSYAGHDLALFRGWWRGHEVNPLHVVALDESDWSVKWISRDYPATSVDRGSLRADAANALLFTSTDRHDREEHVVTLDRGSDLGETKVTFPSMTDGAVGERPAENILETSDHRYVLQAGSLKHVLGDQVLFDMAIPGIGLGSHLGSIVVVKDELLIVANDSIFIVDAATGLLKKRIDSF